MRATIRSTRMLSLPQHVVHLALDAVSNWARRRSVCRPARSPGSPHCSPAALTRQAASCSSLDSHLPRCAISDSWSPGTPLRLTFSSKSLIREGLHGELPNFPGNGAAAVWAVCRVGRSALGDLRRQARAGTRERPQMDLRSLSFRTLLSTARGVSVWAPRARFPSAPQRQEPR